MVVYFFTYNQEFSQFSWKTMQVWGIIFVTAVVYCFFWIYFPSEIEKQYFKKCITPLAFLFCLSQRLFLFAILLNCGMLEFLTHYLYFLQVVSLITWTKIDSCTENDISWLYNLIIQFWGPIKFLSSMSRNVNL